MRGLALTAVFAEDVTPAVGTTKDLPSFDLRLIGAKSLRDLPAAWRRLIDGFDMVGVAPAITPSSLLGF